MPKRGRIRQFLHRLWLAISGHMRWLVRSLRGMPARLAAAYLCFLCLVAGLGVGYYAAPRETITAVQRQRTPPPVGLPPPGHQWVEVLTTGYCPCSICCGKDADGRTAINRDVTKFPYGIAVEPKLIPYRSMLSVPGYGRFMVDDTGGAMRQSAKKGTVHLDLRFKTHQRARKWGRQWLWIAVPEDIKAAQYAYIPPKS